MVKTGDCYLCSDRHYSSRLVDGIPVTLGAETMAISERAHMQLDAARKNQGLDKHVHSWSDWKEIGRTGDWFHPLIVERKCKTCGCSETDEH